MALEVPAPVGEVGDLAAQLHDRESELVAVGLDRVADLHRCALGHQAVPSGSLAETVSRMRRASSIAMSGVGGAPRLTALAAIRPAIRPRMMRIRAIAKKPQK